MIIFEEIKVENFRNIKRIRLQNLMDLNILLGPNNCGKTNLLQLIEHFSDLQCGSAYGYLCHKCNVFMKNKSLEGVTINLSENDFYLKNTSERLKISLSLNKNSVEKFIPRVISIQENVLREASCCEIKDEIILKNEGMYLHSEHFSPFVHRDILQEIKKWILYCPEGRLQEYKGKNFEEYIREKNFSGAGKRRMIDFIARFVDPKIHDYKHEDLIRKIGEKDITVTITEQGSGVRSLICLVADLLAAKDSKILLIDEPELGLNPFAKHEFLKFLLEQADNRQIFIATQDSTFVNPVLWRDHSNKVSVYLFSLLEENFVRIDLGQNREDPNVFAGYLPHTVSLKDIHIYVEGTSDVYIFQILLRKFLQNFCKENWFEVENKIGIFHLCGDFWKHLLYTVPKRPYRCLIILDGDKRNQAQKVIEKHNESVLNASKFEFAHSIKDITRILESDKHPVYCLQKAKIEDYLFPDTLPSDYNKRVDGPKTAEQLDELPEELEEIFKVLILDYLKGIKIQ